METILAIYEQGRLRPLKPLPLRENETVAIQVISVSSGEGTALNALVKAGLVRLVSQTAEPPTVTEYERASAAKSLGEAGPVSTLILRDRD